MALNISPDVFVEFHTGGLCNTSGFLGDKCISVINPGKVESKSADSWRGLMERIRHLTLVAYARAVSKLEDHVRQQRERRNEVGWNFMEYFKLQVSGEILSLVITYVYIKWNCLIFTFLC